MMEIITERYFDFGALLGQGSFGKVYAASKREGNNAGADTRLCETLPQIREK
jgi:hypothetical protein